MAYPGSPLVYNLNLTTSGTEYSQLLPEYTYKLMIRCRTANNMKLAFISGQSGTTYFSILSGEVYWDDAISTGATVYLQSDTSSVVAEILAWTGV